MVIIFTSFLIKGYYLKLWKGYKTKISFPCLNIQINVSPQFIFKLSFKTILFNLLPWWKWSLLIGLKCNKITISVVYSGGHKLTQQQWRYRVQGVHSGLYALAQSIVGMQTMRFLWFTASINRLLTPITFATGFDHPCWKK